MNNINSHLLQQVQNNNIIIDENQNTYINEIKNITHERPAELLRRSLVDITINKVNNSNKNQNNNIKNIMNQRPTNPTYRSLQSGPVGEYDQLSPWQSISGYERIKALESIVSLRTNIELIQLGVKQLATKFHYTIPAWIFPQKDSIKKHIKGLNLLNTAIVDLNELQSTALRQHLGFDRAKNKKDPPEKILTQRKYIQLRDTVQDNLHRVIKTSSGAIEAQISDMHDLMKSTFFSVVISFLLVQIFISSFLLFFSMRKDKFVQSMIVYDNRWKDTAMCVWLYDVVYNFHDGLYETP